MAVKKATTKKTTKASTDNKVVRAAKTNRKIDFSKVVEAHVYVILAIVATAFVVFSAGMAVGAAMIFG